MTRRWMIFLLFVACLAILAAWLPYAAVGQCRGGACSGVDYATVDVKAVVMEAPPIPIAPPRRLGQIALPPRERTYTNTNDTFNDEPATATPVPNARKGTRVGPAAKVGRAVKAVGRLVKAVRERKPVRSRLRRVFRRR